VRECISENSANAPENVVSQFLTMGKGFLEFCSSIVIEFLSVDPLGHLLALVFFCCPRPTISDAMYWYKATYKRKVVITKLTRKRDFSETE